ncbi:MAG: hypothetical protein FWD98_09545 [Defluviitaleaceae bacterium]|nr:hypothetical protein [Defluviitaleaceae bacterium]
MISVSDGGNAVESFALGSTQIKICDDNCRDVTQEDIQAILSRIARQAQNYRGVSEM